MNGVDKSSQEKQAAPEDISGQREEQPEQQSLDDCQAKATVNLKRRPEVENVRRMMEAAALKADEGNIMKWEAEAENRAAEEARVSDLKTKAEDAERKAVAELLDLVFASCALQPNKVYIGGLPENTRQEDLQSCFGKIGDIVDIELKYVSP